MDAPAGRGHTRGLRRACTASAVRGAVTGADEDRLGSRSHACCTFDPTARPRVLVVEGGAPRDDWRGRGRTRLPRGKPTRAIESWRGGRSSRVQLRRRTRSQYCRSWT